MEPIDLLALHGYHGSAGVLRRQLSPITDALPSTVHVTFVDAPSLAHGDFGWWHEGFSGWERTRDWVRELARGQHFDGVLGFSQGAALAGLLLAAQEHGERRESAVRPPRFGFGILVGGFTSDEPQHAELFRAPLSTPSLHVTGAADSIVPMRDSLRLAARFATPSIVRHGGGHVVPADPEVVDRIVDFVVARGRPGAVSTTPGAARRA